MAAVANGSKFDKVQCAIEGVKEIYLVISHPDQVIFEFTSEATMQKVMGAFESFKSASYTFKPLPSVDHLFEEDKHCCGFGIQKSLEDWEPHFGAVLDSFIQAIGAKVSPKQKATKITVKTFLFRKND